MAAAKAGKKRARAQAASTEAAGSQPQGISLTHHEVMAALSRAEVAHELRGLAEEHFDGDWSEVAATICNEAFDQALADARAAYEKAVGNGKAVRS